MESILKKICQVEETSDIAVIAERLRSGDWIAFGAYFDGRSTVLCLGRVLEM